MSRENVEVIRSIYETFAVRGPEAAGEYLDANIEWLPPHDAPTAGIYRGVEQAGAEFADWIAQFQDWTWEPSEFIAAPGERVVVVGRQRGRGRVSGVSVEVPEAHAWTVRDGKATRLEMFRSAEEALDAVGLRR
jgi:hypothetical protein